MATIPKLALIPSGYNGSPGKLYSVLPTDGVGDFDVTRGSIATRINKNGLIETVTGNTPRLNYPLIDGVVQECPSLLLENSATNLVSYSEDFSNAFWSKVASTITSNAAISPDGTLNSDKLVEDTQNVAHITFASPNVTLGNNTFSVFAKAAERRVLGIEFPTNGHLLSFDLIDGVFVNSQANPDNFSITPFPNGWYRIDITENLTSTSVVSLSLRDENGNRTYQGDGTSGVYIWGAQLEQKSYATSYIPTSASAQTRLAETANGAGDASTFNDSEGVLMLEVSALSSSDESSRRLGITKNGTYEGLRLQLGNGNISATVYDGTTNQYSKSVNIDNSISHKVALKYKANDFAIYIDGLKHHAQSTGSTFVEGTLDDISFDYVGANNFYAKTRQVQYYNTALTDLELEKITSYTSFNAMALAQNYTIQ